MNKKQEAILNKEFKVNERFSITRAYYEGLPCQMLAWTWSDKRMTELAAKINENLIRYDENDPDGMDDDFWYTMESEAVKMGMEYYEDFSEDYLESLEYDWNNV